MLSIVDIIAIVVVLIGILLGFRRRFSGELAHLVSIIVAFIVGLMTYRPLGYWLLENSRLGSRAAHAVAFVSTIVLASLVMVLIRTLLKRIISVVLEEETDKIAGVVAGFIKSTLFILIVFLFMNMIPHDYLNRIFGEESAIGRVVLRFMPRIEEKLEEMESLERIKLIPSEKGFSDNV